MYKLERLSWTRIFYSPECQEVVPVLLMIFLANSISGEITISILTENPGISIQHYGSNVDLINVEEAERFQLTPEVKCKNRIGNISGKNPDHCYLKEPTPGQFYPTNNWPEMKSVYVVQKVELVSEKKNLVVLDEQAFENNSNSSINVDVDRKVTLLDSVIHEGIRGNYAFPMPGKVKVKYTSIVGEGGEAGGETSYEHSLGNDEQKVYRKVVEFGADNAMVLLPNGNLTLVVNGYEGSAEYEVTYGNYLTGRVVGQYDKKYDDRSAKGYSTTQLGLPIMLYKERLRVRYLCGKNMTISEIVPPVEDPNVVEKFETLAPEKT